MFASVTDEDLSSIMVSIPEPNFTVLSNISDSNFPKTDQAIVNILGGSHSGNKHPIETVTAKWLVSSKLYIFWMYNFELDLFCNNSWILQGFPLKSTAYGN